MPESYELNHSRTGNSDSTNVLYLHGFMGDSHDWDDIAARLGDRLSHLRVDLPGHGATAPDMPERFYSMAETASLIINLLNTYSIRKCRLIGYSMGARLGLYLLTRYPERFERALIESGSPGLRTEEERTERRKHDAHLADQLRNESLEQFVDRWFDLPLFRTLDRSAPLFSEMIARRRQCNPRLLARSLRQMGTGAQPSLWESLRKVITPTLFVSGELDTKFTTLAGQMADLCRAGQTGIIRSAGHNTHFERPDEFVAQAAQFFDQNR